MKNFLSDLDARYLKIATYAGGCILVTGFLGYLLYHALPSLSYFWKLCLAVGKPALLGGVFAYLLDPMVHSVEKWFKGSSKNAKWARPVSVFLCLIVIIGAILLFLVLVSQHLVTSVSQINFESITGLFANYQNQVNDFLEKAKQYLEQFNIDLPNIGKTFTGAIGSVASGFSTILFALIFAIYYMIDFQNLFNYWQNVLHRLLSPKTINHCKELLQDADRCFSGYIRGQTIDAVLVGVVVTIIFQIIGMPYAPAVGFITGFGNLIPYFGPTLGYIAVILVNLLNGLDLRMMAIGLLILQIIMMIDGNIINPKLLAGAIQVHPLLVVASLLAGGAIGGIMGMLLAVPVGAFLKLQFEKWIASKKPITSDPEDTQQHPA